MKREHFLKTVASFAGGLTLVGCSSDLFSELVNQQPQDTVDITIEEAEQWFNNVYLSKITSARTDKKNKYQRSASWSRAQKPKNTSKKNFVWVPLAYENDAWPGVLVYDDKTLHKKEFAKYFTQPILEALIIYNDGKENKAFLAQIAYDPIDFAANNYDLSKSNFTGVLLSSSWNDELERGAIYEKGKLVKAFTEAKSEQTKNGRITDCTYTYVEYQTYYIDSEGAFTVVLHREWRQVCSGSGSGSSGGGGGDGGWPGDWGGTGGGNGGGDYYDPLVQSGSGGYTIPTTYPLYNFSMKGVVQGNANDRLNFNTNLVNAVNATGLGGGVVGFTWTKADAIIKSIGGNIDEFLPVVNIAGKNVGAIGLGLGIFGVATSGFSLYVALADNNFDFSKSNFEIIQLALATGGVVAGIWLTPWIAGTIGAVSIGVAIYQIATTPSN